MRPDEQGWRQHGVQRLRVGRKAKARHLFSVGEGKTRVRLRRTE